MIALKREVAA